MTSFRRDHYCVSNPLKAALVFFLMCLGLPAFGQSTSVVSGIVTDETGALVVGAEVRLPGLGLSGATDRTGRFRIAGVPSGTHTLEVSYLGRSPFSGSVTTTGASTIQNVSLGSDIIELDEFSVESFVEGQARAINRQRTSNTISNIVAADALGRLPDANVAEALRRLPGISVQNDLGEPEFISVRGTSPKFSAVSLNGERLPSVGDPTESRDNRAVSLHSVPTDMISSIEVVKAITPNMDADSVGANVNLITKTSLEYNRRVLNGKLEAGYNDIRDSAQYSGSLSYGDVIRDGKLGFLIGISTYESERGLDSFTNSYGTRTTTAGVVIPGFMTELQYRHRYLTRSRDAISGQLDFRTGDNATFYVRGFVNSFEDAEERRRLRVGFGDNSRVLPGSTATVAIVDGGRLRREDRIGTKTTDIYNASTGGKWELPGYTVDYSLAYTWTGFKVRRHVYSSEYRLSDTLWNVNGMRLDQDGIPDLTFDRTNVNRPIIGDPFNHFNNLGRFSFNNRGAFNFRDDDTSEEDLTGGVNIKIPGRLGDRPVEWQMGLRYRSKEKDNRPENPRFAIVGAPELTVASFPDTDPLEIFGGSYNVGPSTNVRAARDFFRDPANSNRFVRNVNNDRNDFGASYQATEDIYGAYAMATINLDKLRVVTGLRWERTEVGYDANQRDTRNGAFVGFTPISEKNSYDNLFPSIVTTYRIRDDLLLRGAVTTTIARPDYNLLAPIRTINDTDDTDTISDGNPGLKPFRSVNVDFSIEKYLPTAGILSASIFHKKIKNFTLFRGEFVEGGEFDGFFRTRPENGPRARLTGVELSWTQTLNMLPKPFDGLGIQANLTLVNASAEIDGRGTVDNMTDQVDSVYNIQLVYEIGAFEARVAYFDNGRYIDSFGSTAAGDTWFDSVDSWDLSLNYQLRRGIKLYVDAKNLANSDKKRIYIGTPDQVVEQEFAGWSAVGGVKFEF